MIHCTARHRLTGWLQPWSPHRQLWFGLHSVPTSRPPPTGCLYLLPVSYNRGVIHITSRRRPPCMVLPPIRPLHPDVWDEFMAALKRGPSPKQVQAVERALELARHIPVMDANAVKSEAYRPLQDSPHPQECCQDANAVKSEAYRPLQDSPHPQECCQDANAVKSEASHSPKSQNVG